MNFLTRSALKLLKYKEFQNWARRKAAIGLQVLYNFVLVYMRPDRLCGLVVRVLGYRSGGPGLIPGTTRKKNIVGLERGALSLVSTN
jgi:hypothetical protein